MYFDKEKCFNFGDVLLEDRDSFIIFQSVKIKIKDVNKNDTLEVYSVRMVLLPL